MPRMPTTPPLMRLREWERFSPTSAQFDDPGDRFIPTRSLMDLELAHSLLTERGRRKAPANPVILTPKDEYKRRLEENLTLDAEGKPFRMFVFRKSPRTCKRSLLLVDEMRQEEEERCRPRRPIRRIPTHADRILDGPKLNDDYYMQLMDWGKGNILAVALGPFLYLWNASDATVRLLPREADEADHPTSVAWSNDGTKVAVGFDSSRIELWDAMSLHLVRTFGGHSLRVGCLSWNQNVLTSGSRDTSIMNHDVRSAGRWVSHLRGHHKEVCGLRWSAYGDHLASGGNDNLVHVWDSARMRSFNYLHRFDEHTGAVKALAWCPFQSNTLASGGGTADRCIKIWNTQIGQCTTSIDTSAQVCALEWNRHQKEILSAHGFERNQLSLWAYPSMLKIADLTGHTARVLNLAQSPDGSTVVSAAADETIRFWKVFEPPKFASAGIGGDDYDSPLSLKRMHIR